MKVRLAFAIAAHLEPDILVIDEVLAVGDTDFQKKCLGAMASFGNSGARYFSCRTTLPMFSRYAIGEWSFSRAR